jgi:hypothetical protein
MFAYVLATAAALSWVSPPVPLTDAAPAEKASAEALHWESSYGKALEETRADDQPLLVVLENPSAASARLEPALLGQDAAEGQPVDLLRPYNLCRIDVTTEYGQKVALAFKVKIFPYVAVIDRTGSVILHAKTGQIGSQEWNRMLTTYKDGQRTGTAVSHTTYKPNGSLMFQNPSSTYILNGSYCPSCQRR